MLSFAIGTVVAAAENLSAGDLDEFPANNSDGQLVVTSVQIIDGGLEYALNGVAWYSANQLAFVSEATSETLEYAFNVDPDEEEGGDEEEEEDEDGDEDDTEDGDED